MRANKFGALGLNENDLAVVTTIRDEAKSPARIASSTSLPRTTVIRTLARLKARGLVSSIQTSKRKKWRTNNSDEIRKAVNESLRIVFGSKDESVEIPFSSGYESITVYKGITSVFGIWRRISLLPKSTRIYAIQPEVSFHAALRRGLEKLELKDFISINENIRRNKIIIDGLVHERFVDTVLGIISDKKDLKDFFQSFQGRLADTAGLPSDFLNVNAEMYLVHDSLFIVSWKGPIAVEIKNEHVAALFKGMFEALKYLNHRYDQGARMARKIVEVNVSPR